MPIEIGALSQKYSVTVERGSGCLFPRFCARMAGKKLLVLCDNNTAPYAEKLSIPLRGDGADVLMLRYREETLSADERAVARALSQGEGREYFLAVGSGTLNDIAKYAARLTGKACGIFATAPSMDGFTSGVAALTEGGKKVTRPSSIVSDVLIDFGVLSSAPRIMKGAGAGDILAKYCCLTDWKLSSLLTGEEYGAEAAALMREALLACVDSLPALAEGKEEGTEKLMEALLVSGYAMAEASSSRPASGAEHHISHYLEMEFLKRGVPMPLHGVKVGLGTLVSLYLYHTLRRRPAFDKCALAYAEADALPSVEWARETLRGLGCPVRFSEIGVDEGLLRETLMHAHTLRDRFTILSLYHAQGFMTDAVLGEICGEFL